MENWVNVADILAGVVAFLALGLSIFALFLTYRFDNRRRKLEVITHLREYNDGVRLWGGQVIEKLTDAVFLCERDPAKLENGEFFERRCQLRAELSSLLDKGRLYLPNTNEREIGIWKPGAYRGLRQDALSQLACGYGLVESLDYREHEPNKRKRQQIVDVKREFTSTIQDLLAVRETSNENTRLANEIQSTDAGNGTT